METHIDGDGMSRVRAFGLGIDSRNVFLLSQELEDPCERTMNLKSPGDSKLKGVN